MIMENNNNNNPPTLIPDVLVLTTTIICKECHQDVGFSKEDILKMSINEDIRCPICDCLMYSCKPEKPKWTTYGSSYSCGGAYGAYPYGED